MMYAAPRKNANGECSIRPWRIGTNSASRLGICSSSRPIGSGRSSHGTQPAWLARGTSARACLPRAVL